MAGPETIKTTCAIAGGGPAGPPITAAAIGLLSVIVAIAVAPERMTRNS